MWAEFEKAEILHSDILDYFQKENRKACLSSYALFELSKAPHKIKYRDQLFYTAKNVICIPSLYDQVIEAEINCHPRKWRMQWLPLIHPTINLS